MSVGGPQSIPRESGDDPKQSKAYIFVQEVFPARAGMIPEDYLEARAEGGIPRESGDDPATKTGLPASARYSPRERG